MRDRHRRDCKHCGLFFAFTEEMIGVAGVLGDVRVLFAKGDLTREKSSSCFTLSLSVKLLFEDDLLVPMDGNGSRFDCDTTSRPTCGDLFIVTLLSVDDLLVFNLWKSLRFKVSERGNFEHFLRGVHSKSEFWDFEEDKSFLCGTTSQDLLLSFLSSLATEHASTLLLSCFVSSGLKDVLISVFIAF